MKKENGGKENTGTQAASLVKKERSPDLLNSEHPHRGVQLGA
jgi:hypothetical protein